MGENSVQDNRGSWRRDNSLKVKGLERHLNETAAAHKGRDYNYFVGMYQDGQSRAAIAKAFGVNFRTADSWYKLYEEEQSNKNGIHAEK